MAGKIMNIQKILRKVGNTTAGDTKGQMLSKFQFHFGIAERHVK
jgi:hypothetical protein